MFKTTVWTLVFLAGAARLCLAGPYHPVQNERAVELAKQVREKGWIVYCARSAKGDWDLFLCRPDGSSVHNITRSPGYNEAAPRFSPDGTRLLYRRLARSESINGNSYGAQGVLVFSGSDGAEPTVYGKSGQYPWACWGPEGRQITCLTPKGIIFVNLATKNVTRTLPRRGFFQQLCWSPDGRWLGGVANSFGTGWSVARMNAATGSTNAVSRIDCCTPDWFPNCRELIFSNRPAGQGQENNGQGWTQLWMADAEGKAASMIYGEDGRHVYGGCISPDGRYVLFTGNKREDGDPCNSGAPMGLMRLEDAPTIGGQSKTLRKTHPDTKDGQVLQLPAGWEPHWTSAEINLSKDKRVTQLAEEVRNKGWLVYSAKIGTDNWDLFIMRPDGSERKNITNTPQFNEAAAKFSPNGRKILYYRMPKETAVDNNKYGTYELVIADSDGTNPRVYGSNYHWASWSPDGRQLACLSISGVQIIDLAAKKVIQTIDRKGMVEQLVWSPDGKWFCGTANGLGQYWTIGRMSASTGRLNAVSDTDRYNCTPDWFPDSQHLLYSRGIIPEVGGWAQLWKAHGRGREKEMIYAETARHIYGGMVSPDGRYVVFTRSQKDLGQVDNSFTTMALMRLEDAPIIVGTNQQMRKQYPEAKDGPALHLWLGWEPCWTYADIGVKE